MPQRRDWPAGYLTSRAAQAHLECDRVTLHRLARRQGRIRVQEVGGRLGYCAADVQRVAEEERAQALALEQQRDDYLLVDEVVERLACSPDYPYILVLRGQLSRHSLGGRQVFARSEVEALQEKRAQQERERERQQAAQNAQQAKRAARQRQRQQRQQRQQADQEQAQRERQRTQRERKRTQQRQRQQRQLPAGYLTSREAAARLGMTRQGVAQLAERGRIRTTRAANQRTVGYLAEDVAQWAARGKATSKPPT